MGLVGRTKNLTAEGTHKEKRGDTVIGKGQSKEWQKLGSRSKSERGKGKGVTSVGKNGQETPLKKRFGSKRKKSDLDWYKGASPTNAKKETNPGHAKPTGGTWEQKGKNLNRSHQAEKKERGGGKERPWGPP